MWKAGRNINQGEIVKGERKETKRGETNNEH